MASEIYNNKQRIDEALEEGSRGGDSNNISLERARDLILADDSIFRQMLKNDDTAPSLMICVKKFMEDVESRLQTQFIIENAKSDNLELNEQLILTLESIYNSFYYELLEEYEVNNAITEKTFVELTRLATCMIRLAVKSNKASREFELLFTKEILVENLDSLPPPKSHRHISDAFFKAQQIEMAKAADLEIPKEEDDENEIDALFEEMMRGSVASQKPESVVDSDLIVEEMMPESEEIEDLESNAQIGTEIEIGSTNATYTEYDSVITDKRQVNREPVRPSENSINKEWMLALNDLRTALFEEFEHRQRQGVIGVNLTKTELFAMASDVFVAVDEQIRSLNKENPNYKSYYVKLPVSANNEEYLRSLAIDFVMSTLYRNYSNSIKPMPLDKNDEPEDRHRIQQNGTRTPAGGLRVVLRQDEDDRVSDLEVPRVPDRLQRNSGVNPEEAGLSDAFYDDRETVVNRPDTRLLQESGLNNNDSERREIEPQNVDLQSEEVRDDYDGFDYEDNKEISVYDERNSEEHRLSPGTAIINMAGQSRDGEKERKDTLRGIPLPEVFGGETLSAAVQNASEQIGDAKEGGRIVSREKSEKTFPAIQMPPKEVFPFSQSFRPQSKRESTIKVQATAVIEGQGQNSRPELPSIIVDERTQTAQWRIRERLSARIPSDLHYPNGQNEEIGASPRETTKEALCKTAPLGTIVDENVFETQRMAIAPTLLDIQGVSETFIEADSMERISRDGIPISASDLDYLREGKNTPSTSPTSFEKERARLASIKEESDKLKNKRNGYIRKIRNAAMGAIMGVAAIAGISQLLSISANRHKHQDTVAMHDDSKDSQQGNEKKDNVAEKNANAGNADKMANLPNSSKIDEHKDQSKGDKSNISQNRLDDQKHNTSYDKEKIMEKAKTVAPRLYDLMSKGYSMLGGKMLGEELLKSALDGATSEQREKIIKLFHDFNIGSSLDANLSIGSGNPDDKQPDRFAVGSKMHYLAKTQIELRSKNLDEAIILEKIKTDPEKFAQLELYRKFENEMRELGVSNIHNIQYEEKIRIITNEEEVKKGNAWPQYKYESALNESQQEARKNGYISLDNVTLFQEILKIRFPQNFGANSNSSSFDDNNLTNPSNPSNSIDNSKELNENKLGGFDKKDKTVLARNEHLNQKEDFNPTEHFLTTGSLKVPVRKDGTLIRNTKEMILELLLAKSRDYDSTRKIKQLVSEIKMTDYIKYDIEKNHLHVTLNKETLQIIHNTLRDRLSELNNLNLLYEIDAGWDLREEKTTQNNDENEELKKIDEEWERICLKAKENTDKQVRRVEIRSKKI